MSIFIYSSAVLCFKAMAHCGRLGRHWRRVNNFSSPPHVTHYSLGDLWLLDAQRLAGSHDKIQVIKNESIRFLSVVKINRFDCFRTGWSAGFHLSAVLSADFCFVLQLSSYSTDRWSALCLKQSNLLQYLFGVAEFSQYTLHPTYVTKVLPSKKKKQKQTANNKHVP